MMRNILLGLLCFWSSVLSAQNITLSGYVRDASSGEALIGATVRITNLASTGAITNTYGYYSITLPQGNYDVAYSFVGYETDTKSLNLQADTKLDVALDQGAVTLQEVTVKGGRVSPDVESVDMSRENLQIEKIKNIPALMGEVDVLKSVQLLPGIMSAGEGTTGLFVRGGSSDQNLILLDEATVYNSSHLLGFFSVFNPDAVKNVEVYKGGIPAKYGGRLSSIIDIQMREGNNKHFAGSGGIGTISSRFTLEGPIKKNKASFLISARRTYADLFLKLSNNPDLKDNSLYFYDLNAKVNWTINDRNKVYFSNYFGRDNLGIAKQFGFNWGNATSTLRWNHLFSDKLFMNLTGLYSNFDYGFKIDDSNQNFDWSSSLQEYDGKFDFEYYPNPHNTISFGTDFIYHVFKPAKIVSDDNVSESQILLDNQYAWENAIYVSNEQKVNEKWSLTYGLRYSQFARIGKGKVYQYEAGKPRSEETVVDSTMYGPGKLMQYYGGLEPRLGVRYLLNKQNSLKFSYNRTRQYLQVASNSTAGFPTDRWIPADQFIKPLIGDQVAMGWFRSFEQKTYEASVEVYYKWMQQIIDFKPGANILLNNNLEQVILPGKGWAYGAEFMLKKNIGDWTGWLSYTLSRTMRQVPGVSGGNPYPARYDRTHDISLVSTYQFNPRLSLSANFVYSTGQAVSFPEGRYNLDGQSVAYYNDLKRNSSRMPDYHRLDLSLNWDLKKKRPDQKWEQSLNFSIYNVYNRKNAFSIQFREVTNNDPNYDATTDGPVVSKSPSAVKTSLFGIIPSVTYNFKF